MHSPSLRASPSLRILGPAVTVKMVLASDTAAPRPPHHFVDATRPGCVMYVQQPKDLYSACWGGLMTTRAKYVGAEGVVVDGRIRDLAEHHEADFPVRLQAPVPNTPALPRGQRKEDKQREEEIGGRDFVWIFWRKRAGNPSSKTNMPPG